MTKWTNWEKRIEAAKERGRFTEEDKQLSDDWPTCAVGEREDVKKTIWGAPVNVFLNRLGNDFNRLVQFDKVAEAAEVFKKIG